MRKLPRSVFSAVVVIGVGLLAQQSGMLSGFFNSEASASVAGSGIEAENAQYRLTAIEMRPIVEKVSATGALFPMALVSVSSQVSGQLKEIYADFNSEVKRGDPIALIDPVTFEIAVDQARAELEIAQAGVATQEATLDRMVADLEMVGFDLEAAHANTEYAAVKVADAEKDHTRKKSLANSTSTADVDRAYAVFLGTEAQLRSAQATERAKGSVVKSAEAALRSAQAQLLNLQASVRQREAVLRQVQIELENTVVRAPVDGTIIVRNVEVGQTVAVSLQAPVLFTIAQDLREMQVNASITEAEIGRIQLGQRIEFTVDAYAGRVFVGEIAQIRMQPQTTQNVVNYTVVATAPNPDLLLLPGMTATSSIIVQETAPVLTVVSSALRFRPPGVSRTGENQLYIYQNDEAVAVPVELGATDGTFVAINGEGIAEGTKVVLGYATPDKQELNTAGGGFLGLF